MKKVSPKVIKALKARQRVMEIVPGNYIANLEGRSSTPILSALYTGMSVAHLPNEEWFNIIRALLPEITTYTELAQQLNVSKFYFLRSDVGESRLSTFIEHVRKQVEVEQGSCE